MWTDWKIDMAMADSMGDPLDSVMHSMGTDSVTGWNTVSYTSNVIQECASTMCMCAMFSCYIALYSNVDSVHGIC